MSSQTTADSSAEISSSEIWTEKQNFKSVKEWPKYTAEDVMKHNKYNDAWCIINKKVYNITNWAGRHPGGRQIVLNIAGRDITDVYYLNHIRRSDKWLPGLQIGELVGYEESQFVKNFRKFCNEVEEQGYYKVSFLYYFIKISISLILLGIASYLMVTGGQKQCVYTQLAGAFMLGVFFQQSAFIGHDVGHNQVFKDRFKDSIFGALIGPLMMGVSIAWWKDSHNIHHEVPNSYQHDPDIQHLPAFAVTNKYFHSVYSYYHQRKLIFNKVGLFFVKRQHMLYWPIMCIARGNLYVQSAIMLLFKENAYLRKTEMICTIIFWIWMYHLHSFCSSGQLAFGCLCLSHAVAGILHIQITLSHFSMEIFDDVNYKNDCEQFFDTQMRSSLDIDCYKWMDWFHGGLQFQVAHHLFPLVPRHNLRQLQEKLKKFCKENGRVYNSYSFLDANIKTYWCLKKTAEDAKKGKFVNYENKIWEAMNLKG